MRALLTALVIPLSVVALGCADAGELSKGDGLTLRPPKKDAGAEVPVEDDPDAGAPEVRAEQDAGAGTPPVTQVDFTGKMPATNPVPFGGGGFCTYKVTMKNIAVKITVVDRVMAAEVTNTMVEEIVGTCQYTPAPPSAHSYTMTENLDRKTTATTERLTMAGKSTNAPNTILTVQVTKNGPNYDAALTWKRNDGNDPVLLWTVNAKMVLTKP
jgi:hypothetical protein